MRQADVLVLPSLYECGGAVVLEAMASGLPVIATHWGGPADYLTPECGILVAPTDRPEFIKGLRDAMRHLASRGDLRRQLGQAGRARAVAQFDWERKIDAILDIYADAICRYKKTGVHLHSSGTAPGLDRQAPSA
jgi:glycosyltransferase involved in cell wall biosynthesis